MNSVDSRINKLQLTTPVALLHWSNHCLYKQRRSHVLVRTRVEAKTLEGKLVQSLGKVTKPKWPTRIQAEHQYRQETAANIKPRVLHEIISVRRWGCMLIN